ncbi:hypothetical protein GGQ98_000451 [Sphingosinicella soli]|uniref:Uncharacterized protein n=1 Tax=Sphingosinicella soli TaxID=333708 RepID=A0A7W7F519_9SPHN|nr:hypothetical protein [Sphingosinicella soli]
MAPALRAVRIDDSPSGFQDAADFFASLSIAILINTVAAGRNRTPLRGASTLGLRARRSAKRPPNSTNISTVRGAALDAFGPVITCHFPADASVQTGTTDPSDNLYRVRALFKQIGERTEGVLAPELAKVSAILSIVGRQAEGFPRRSLRHSRTRSSDPASSLCCATRWTSSPGRTARAWVTALTRRGLYGRKALPLIKPGQPSLYIERPYASMRTLGSRSQ